MTDPSELFTIGQLSRSAGVPVKTIRFWSDSGLVPPAGRSFSGYRLYDAEAVARLDLVRTLRGLGLDLDTVGQILDRQALLSEVAREHVRALDAEIRILTLRRAVLRWVAAHGSSQEETRLMHDLASLSAQERQQIINDFVDETFAGLDPSHIAQAMRAMRATLPEEPTSEQVEAWVELAGLVSDPGFKQRVREMATTATVPADQSDEKWKYQSELIAEHAGAAVAAGIAPASPEGQTILNRIVAPDLPAEDRLALADTIDTYSDQRVERYWQLMGILNDRPPFPAQTPLYDWLMTALRATEVS
jgi:DNA-binding transcriptional MerR regulator